MAPGPPSHGTLGTNRFAMLADSSKIKKKKQKQNKQKIDITDIFDFPILPTVIKNTSDPKYITIESTEQNKPISQFSCFAVHKAICAVSSEINTVSELRDGKILLLVKNKKIAERFIALKQLPGICSIKAKYHDNLNFTKGTVFAPFLNNVSETEIVSELGSQGVVAAYKFQRKNESNQPTPTGVVLLTFDLYNLPGQLDIAWRKVNVRQYIPNPMRCKNCQLLGHTIKHCKGKAACNNCNLPPHNPKTCTRTLCANCFADHPASSNKCPKYNQAKQIQTIKTTKKCTMREAVKIYNSTVSLPENAPSFASTLSRSTNKQNIQETQHDNSPLNDTSTNYSSTCSNSPNNQELSKNNTQTHTVTPTTIINESTTPIPDSYSNTLSTPVYSDMHEQSYYALTQHHHPHFHSLNNTSFDSYSNSATDLSIDLPSNSNKNRITSYSDNFSLPHTDDTVMTHGDFAGMSSDDE